jgi:hypothetical protein
LLAEWRDIIESYEEAHNGTIPTGSDINWILGVHHHMPPVELVKGLLTGKRFADLYNK